MKNKFDPRFVKKASYIQYGYRSSKLMHECNCLPYLSMETK